MRHIQKIMQLINVKSLLCFFSDERSEKMTIGHYDGRNCASDDLLFPELNVINSFSDELLNKN